MNSLLRLAQISTLFCLLLVSVAVASPRTKKSKCLGDEINHGIGEIQDQYFVHDPAGNKLPLTFSIDSETQSSEIMYALAGDPISRSMLEAHLNQIDIHTLSTNLLQVSEGQLKAFGLRKGVPKDQTHYSILDLNADI